MILDILVYGSHTWNTFRRTDHTGSMLDFHPSWHIPTGAIQRSPTPRRSPLEQKSAVRELGARLSTSSASGLCVSGWHLEKCTETHPPTGCRLMASSLSYAVVVLYHS